MAKMKITLVRSGIDRPENQKRTLKALGLTKAALQKRLKPA